MGMFWNKIKALGFKIKIFLGVILGVLGLVLYGVARRKPDPKGMMEHRLTRLKSEMEIAKLEEKTEENLKKLESLESEEADLRKKLVELAKLTPEERVSLGDLDKFFDERGF